MRVLRVVRERQRRQMKGCRRAGENMAECGVNDGLLGSRANR